MEELKRYEGMIIIDPSVQTKGCNDSIKRVEEFIKEKGGTLIYTEKIGIMNLAYEIKKKKKGFYYYFEFTLAPDKLGELNTLFRRDEQIIRNIIIALNKDAIDYNDAERKRKKTVKQTLVLVKEEKKKNKYLDPTKKMFCRFDRYGFINYIDYKNVNLLYKFLNLQGRILPRRYTGNRKKWQGKLATGIKRSRQMGILPYSGDNLK